MKLFALLFSFLVLAQATFAAPAASTSTSSNLVYISPSTLRLHLLNQNIDIATALNSVQQAKQQVNIARGNLLPSVNLGAAIVSGPSFMMTTISFLMPFLMPSKWMDLYTSTSLLNAQTSSYYISQLNVLASAYSVYATCVGDQQLREALYKQYEAYKAIEDQLKLPADIGMIRKEDYLQAQAQSQMTYVQVSQVDELIIKEKAALRHMLGLSLEKEIILETTHVPVTNFEDLKADKLIDLAQAVSPESTQIEYLIDAAQFSKWSQAFSFLSGTSLSETRMMPNSAFSAVRQTGSVNFGFAYFPTIELNNLNIEQIRLRKKELKLNQGQILETTLGSLVEAKKQLEAATAAENNLRKVYDAELMRYQVGMTDIVHVLQAGKNVSAALVNKVKASTELDTLRISLNRVLLLDQFAKVEKCSLQKRNDGSLIGRFGRIFTLETASLDQVCGF